MTSATTLYDIRSEPAPVGNEIRGGLAGSLIGALLLALVWKRPERAPKLFLAAWILGWGGFSAWNGFQIARLHREAAASLSRGDVESAEGVVTDLVPAPPEGGFETFRLGGRTFRLSDGSTTGPGLNRTSARGGPVRAGAHLRIAFRGPSILRVEELEAAAAPAP